MQLIFTIGTLEFSTMHINHTMICRIGWMNMTKKRRIQQLVFHSIEITCQIDVTLMSPHEKKIRKKSSKRYIFKTQMMDLSCIQAVSKVWINYLKKN